MKYAIRRSVIINNILKVLNFSFTKENRFVPFRPFPLPAIPSDLTHLEKKLSCEEVNMVICCLHCWW